MFSCVYCLIVTLLAEVMELGMGFCLGSQYKPTPGD